jgi:hypothetical protein
VRAGVSYRPLGDDGRVFELAVDLPDDGDLLRAEITAGGRSYTLDARSLNAP